MYTPGCANGYGAKDYHGKRTHLAPSTLPWRAGWSFLNRSRECKRALAGEKSKRIEHPTPSRLGGGLSRSAHAAIGKSSQSALVSRCVQCNRFFGPGGIRVVDTVRKMRLRRERSRGLRATFSGTRDGGVLPKVSEKNRLRAQRSRAAAAISTKKYDIVQHAEVRRTTPRPPVVAA